MLAFTNLRYQRQATGNRFQPRFICCELRIDQELAEGFRPERPELPPNIDEMCCRKVTHPKNPQSRPELFFETAESAF